MATTFPSSEIRQLVVHTYPGGIKASTAERLTSPRPRCWCKSLGTSTPA
jgi:hypothetical protein